MNGFPWARLPLARLPPSSPRRGRRSIRIRSFETSADMALSGVVLCGGRSTRMGRDKALLNIEGKPLFARVAEILAEVAWPVFLAPGTPGRLGEVGYPNVADAVPDSGPLGGVIGALRVSPHDLVAVSAVDMPFANAGVFRLLAGLAEAFDAVVPVTPEGPQPLHAVYARTALPALETVLVDGSFSMKGALQSLHVREVHQNEWGHADPSGRFAFNLNRPDDMAQIRSRVEPDPAG